MPVPLAGFVPVPLAGSVPVVPDAPPPGPVPVPVPLPTVVDCVAGFDTENGLLPGSFDGDEFVPGKVKGVVRSPTVGDTEEFDPCADVTSEAVIGLLVGYGKPV